MIVELTTVTKETQLAKWHRVHSLNGVQKVGMYVQFKFAWDQDGKPLSVIPKSVNSVFVDMEYNGVGYP